MSSTRSPIPARVLPMFLLLAVFAAPRPLLADGCFVWRAERRDITEPEQKAIIAFRNGWEELTLEVKYAGPPDEFGWVVPLPARPTLHPAQADCFRELSMITEMPHFGRSARVAHLNVTLGSTRSEPVQVLERRRVGLYDAAVLSSPDGAALQAWLRANAFHVEPTGEEILDGYARQGWVFVAFRILAAEGDSVVARQLATGTIQPVRLCFPAREPIFPLRISAINGNAADLLVYLLADDHYVNGSCRQADWETRMCGPLEFSRADPDSHFAPDGRPLFFVSKLRAHLEPGQMEDLTFAPYDPAPDLVRPELERRIQAASYIGWKKRIADAPLLIEFLRPGSPDRWGPVSTQGKAWRPRPFGPGQDIQSALWALGQLGTPEAVRCLVHWAAGEPSEPTLEALEALQRNRVPEVLPLLLKQIQSTPGWNTDPVARELESLAYEGLVAQGDSTCLPRLRELARVPRNVDGWEGPDRGFGHPGVDGRITCVLAACGDGEAFRRIVAGVVEGSDATTMAQLEAEAGRVNRGYGYPSTLPVSAVLFDRTRWFSAPSWPALTAAMLGLEARPALRDSLLRTAAADDRVPPMGQTLLLGLIEKPRVEDRTRLDGLGAAALARPVVVPVGVPTGAAAESNVREPFNLPASAVIAALTRWRDVGALRRLWSTCARADATMRGEIVAGLADCADPLDLGRIEEYVRDEWVRRVRAPEFRKALERQVAAGPRPEGQVRIDASYRADKVRCFFRAIPGGRAAALRLMADGNLPPAVRLWWVIYTEGPDPARLAALEEIEAAIPAGEPLLLVAQEVRREIEWGVRDRAAHDGFR